MQPATRCESAASTSGRETNHTAAVRSRNRHVDRAKPAQSCVPARDVSRQSIAPADRGAIGVPLFARPRPMSPRPGTTVAVRRETVRPDSVTKTTKAEAANRLNGDTGRPVYTPQQTSHTITVALTGRWLGIDHQGVQRRDNCHRHERRPRRQKPSSNPRNSTSASNPTCKPDMDSR